MLFASGVEREIHKNLPITKFPNQRRSLAYRKVLANHLCRAVVISRALSRNNQALWKIQEKVSKGQKSIFNLDSRLLYKNLEKE